MNKKIILVSALGLLLVGCGKESTTAVNSKNGNTENQAVEQKEEMPDYTITDVAEERDEFSLYVTGIVKNNTDKDLSYLSVTIPMKDSDGNKTGDAIDNVNNIGPGETWKFKAIYLGDDHENVVWNPEDIVVEGF